MLTDNHFFVSSSWDFNSIYNQNYKDALDYLENSVVKANGYVIAIMNERILNPNSGSRYELIKAIRDNKTAGSLKIRILNMRPCMFLLHR